MALSEQRKNELRKKYGKEAFSTLKTPKTDFSPTPTTAEPESQGGIKGLLTGALKRFGGGIARSLTSTAARGLVEHSPMVKALDPSRQFRKSIPQELETPLGTIEPRLSDDPVTALKQTAEDILNVAPGGTFTKPLKQAASRAAPKLVNRIVKPLAKEFRYGKNPGKVIAEEGIIAGSVEQLGARVAKRKSEIGERIGEAVSSPEVQKRSLKLRNVVKPLQQEIERLGKIGTSKQPVINRLNSVLEDILNKTTVIDGKVEFVGKRNLARMTPLEAHELRRHVGDLTTWEGVASDKPVNAALKRVYMNINKQLERFVPELNELSGKYSNLLTAESAVKRAIAREQKNAFLGLGGKLSTVGAGVMTAIGTGGLSVPAIVATAGTATLSKLFSHPAFKTRAAKMLANLGREERKVLFENLPLLRAAIIEEFGNQFDE